MDKNEIKKALYKQNPNAALMYIRKGHAYYKAMIERDSNFNEVIFKVPVDDMGDADFLTLMQAKLLARWICELELIKF